MDSLVSRAPGAGRIGVSLSVPSPGATVHSITITMTVMMTVPETL